MPESFDVSTAEKVAAEPTVASYSTKELSALSKVGFKLAIFVLSIISLCIVGVILWSYGLYSHALTVSATMPPEVALKVIVEQQEFLFKMAQMILLNLLLPTLSAILGYVFGSTAK